MACMTHTVIHASSISLPKERVTSVTFEKSTFPHFIFDFCHSMKQLGCFWEEISENWILLPQQVEQHLVEDNDNDLHNEVDTYSRVNATL